MAVPLIPLGLGTAGLYGLYRYLASGGGGTEPALTPAPTATNVGQQSQQVAASGVENNPPPQTEPTSTTPAPPAGARAPVATPGEAAEPPAQDPMETLRAIQANNPQAAEPTEDPDVDRNRRLAQFGFAMAASRNPSLFGMIGEAGLAMQRGNREEREDDRRDREVDVNAEYRRAQIELARREREWEENPNNPRTVAALAQARYHMARAATAGSGGGNSRIAGQIIGDDGVVYGVTRDGQAIPYTMPDGTPLRRGQTENWQAQYTSAYNSAMTRLSTIGNPAAALPEDERQRRAHAEATALVENLRRNLSRPGQPAQPQTQAPAAAAVPYRTIPLTPPR